MGLMDRDYMHDGQRQRPFSPPPERFNWATLGMVLVFVIALFFLYKAADWKLKQGAASTANERLPPSAVPKNPPSGTLTAFTQPSPALPPAQNTPDMTASTSTVSKCVVNGRTSYSDAPCPDGATGSQITTHANHNLMAAVRPPPVRHTEAQVIQRPIFVTQNDRVPAAVAHQAECQGLDAQIKRWDAMARQPQSGQMQDWISEERKKARDRQFRIRCQ